MRSPMDEKTYLGFYKNTNLGSSKNLQGFICKQLETLHMITYDEQLQLIDSTETVYFESKKDIGNIIAKTSIDKNFIPFYEKIEFTKLYKYSVPFFYELDKNQSIESIIKDKNISIFDENNYKPQYILDTLLKETVPIAWIDEERIFLKFVLQKSYPQSETYESVDYRYPIVIYFDCKDNCLEIRYDSMRYSEVFDNEAYCKIVNACISWIKQELGINLYVCEHTDTIKIINDKLNTDVKMYKQMMELSSGGSAELKASESADYVLP